MSASPLSPDQRRQVWLLTLAAAALLAALCLFRVSPAPTHMDFVAGGPGALEFCDPANPRFLPVVARSSPVMMTLSTAAGPVAGAHVDAVLALRTNTGKPIGPDELIPTVARKLNLLVVDPALQDFQTPVATPGRLPGEWTFAFIPARAGVYRVFADFTPRATGREMYASADIAIGGGGSAAPPPSLSQIRERDGLRLELVPSVGSIRARESLEMKFTVARLDGGPVALRPIDGVPARLVAFDQNRTGLVNLLPEPVAAAPGGPSAATFKLSIPDPGRYVIWSRVDAGGGEITAPFWFEVVP